MRMTLYTSLSSLLVTLGENQARTTRSGNPMALKVPNIKTTMGRKAFAYHGSVHWLFAIKVQFPLVLYGFV